MELGSQEQQDALVETMNNTEFKDDTKIESVKNLFITSGAEESTQFAVKDYTDKAFSVLETLNISEEKKQILKLFGEQLMNRRV